MIHFKKIIKMKNLKILSGLLLSLLFFSHHAQAQSSSKTEKASKNKIEVLNFHSTHRCMTCNAIEANTKYTLETYFEENLKNGSITQQTINVDEEKNEQIAEKFEASGTSLFLNIIVNGKEKQINLTNFAFTKGRDKEAFSEDLKGEIAKWLKKL